MKIVTWSIQIRKDLLKKVSENVEGKKKQDQ